MAWLPPPPSRWREVGPCAFPQDIHRPRSGVARHELVTVGSGRGHAHPLGRRPAGKVGAATQVLDEGPDRTYVRWMRQEYGERRRDPREPPTSWHQVDLPYDALRSPARHRDAWWTPVLARAGAE